MQITKENLTIIIVTIKSEKIIENCLNSIDPNIKKIIVENSSDEVTRGGCGGCCAAQGWWW